MKSNYLLLATLAAFVVMAFSSCGGKPHSFPSVAGTYTGTSTPSTGSAYPDTVIINQSGNNPAIIFIRTFHAQNHYYTFGLNGSVISSVLAQGYSASLSIPDTTIFFSPSPAAYSAKGNMTDSGLTLHDVFVYMPGDTGTGFFVGVRH